MVPLRETVAVLALAYGGPASLDEVEPFLRRIMAPREPSAEAVERAMGRYGAIGGRSPLLENTLTQARLLQDTLDRASAADPDPGSRGYVVSVGMRHTTPTISAALEHAAESGARLVVAVIMASHQSDRATGAYVRDLESAYDALPPGLRRRTERPLVVPPWHMSPKYLRAVADRVQEALSAVDDVSTSGTPVLFTAHSLPLDEGQGDEQYEAALEETARGVMGLIGPLPWRLAYQSASPVRSVRWLGPSVDEVLRELARAGARDVVVTPLGFVSEHLETLYDLDVELAEVARGAGLHMIRAQTVGASPVFAEALADAIRACAARDVAPDVGDRSATAEEVG